MHCDYNTIWFIVYFYLLLVVYTSLFQTKECALHVFQDILTVSSQPPSLIGGEQGFAPWMVVLQDTFSVQDQKKPRTYPPSHI